MRWLDIINRYNEYVNTKKITSSSTQEDCYKVLSYIGNIKGKDFGSSYFLVKDLFETVIFRDGTSYVVFDYLLEEVCRNTLDLEIKSYELLFVIAFDNNGSEVKYDPVEFITHVRSKVSKEILFNLCKETFYNGKLNKDELNRLVKELGKDDMVKLFLDIDISKRPIGEEKEHTEHRYILNPYFEKKVSYSYNEYIAELLQKYLSPEEQFDFVFKRHFFNRENDKSENWGLSYYLIDRLG